MIDMMTGFAMQAAAEHEIERQNREILEKFGTGHTPAYVIDYVGVWRVMEAKRKEMEEDE